MTDEQDEHVDAVLALVAQIPPGRAMTYGTIAEVLADRALAEGRRPFGGPRHVGRALARAGSGVPWWRVVNAAGRPPARHATRALALLTDEGTPLSEDGERVVLRRAIWFPDD